MSVHQMDEFRMRRSIEARFREMGVPLLVLGAGVLLCVPPHGRAVLIATRWDEECERMSSMGARVVQVASVDEAVLEYELSKEMPL